MRSSRKQPAEGGDVARRRRSARVGGCAGGRAAYPAGLEERVVFDLAPLRVRVGGQHHVSQSGADVSKWQRTRLLGTCISRFMPSVLARLVHF